MAGKFVAGKLAAAQSPAREGQLSQRASADPNGERTPAQRQRARIKLVNAMS